ncbi:RNA polymerase I subunit E [Carabus blaptoides fortunei]
MPECDIISMDCDESTFLPKIVNFQNGQLQPNNERKLQCAAYLNPKTNKTVMALATNKMLYTGEEDTENNLCYTLLTIRNKKTNKIRLVPVNMVSLNVEMPKINALLDNTLNNSQISVRDLNKQFGSKKTKRRTEQMERMKLNVSNVEEELKQTVAEIEVKEEDLVAPTMDESEKSYRPPMNRNASSPSQVYDLKTIIQQEYLDTLVDLANEVLENPIENDKFTPFVATSISTLKKLSTTSLEKYQLLLYIDAILKFFKMPVQTLKRKKLELDPYPEKLVQKILQDFTVFSDNSRSRPMSMRDKATCYIIILALMVMDYRLELEELSKTLGVGLKKLLDVSRVLGAQPASGKEKNVIVLKLPLPTAPTGLGKRKRK